MSAFSLSFILDYEEESRNLNLTLKAAYDTPKLSKAIIDDAIESSEYSVLYVIDENINTLLNQAEEILEKGNKLHRELISKHSELIETSSMDVLDLPTDSDALSSAGTIIPASEILAKLGKLTLSYQIAEVRDASISINVDDEGLRAYLTIGKPYGGDEANSESLAACLKENGINYGIDDKALETAISLKSCEDMLIASGTKPKKGKASRFRALVSNQITTGPTIDEKGRANYHDINEFVIVEPGTPLMERTLPGKGKPGTDVFGGVIPPIQGDILPFSTDIDGAELEDTTKNRLIATMKGHPVIGDRGVSVSNVLMLKNIGLATGNVEFDGSVCVEQDVSDGVSIDVTGDLTVKGVVGKANIRAGGNVVILQGLLGGSREPQKTDDDAPFGANIEAKGSVSAHFVTRSRITAGKHIVAIEYISHSELNAERQILIGQSSGKGNLFGGRAFAFDQVAAKVIGSTGGTPTYIKVGADGDNIIKLRKISKLKRLNDQHTYDVNEELHKISLLAKSAGMTPQMKDKVEKLSQKLETLKKELTELETDEDSVKTLLVKSKKSRVIANQKVFNNTIVSILGSEMTIKEESKGGTFRFEARKVVFEP